jgi:type I restriction enzyme M protein
VLPQEEYDRFTRSENNRNIPKALLKLFSDIPLDASGDVFGQIYEYFLSNFALSEGQGGGEFFTPRSVVRLMVEIIEPHGGKVFDPACGSGGMFVQSAQFIEQHRQDAAADLDMYVYGTEKTMETVKLAKIVQQPVSGRAGAGRGDRTAHGFRSTQRLAGAAAHGVQGQAKLRSGLA